MMTAEKIGTIVGSLIGSVIKATFYVSVTLASLRYIGAW